MTSEQLTRAYLDRIEAFDRNGIKLNALVVMNPDALADAAHRMSGGPKAR